MKKILGFTLIELMVAMTIIGILVAISTTAYQGAKRSARDADRKTDLEDLRSALEIYRADCGRYPAEPLPWGAALTATCNGVTNTYMSQIPQDPQNSNLGYRYEYVTNGTFSQYSICTTLENSTSTGTTCVGNVGRNCHTSTASCKHRVDNP